MPVPSAAASRLDTTAITIEVIRALVRSGYSNRRPYHLRVKPFQVWL